MSQDPNYFLPFVILFVVLPPFMRFDSLKSTPVVCSSPSSSFLLFFDLFWCKIQNLTKIPFQRAFYDSRGVYFEPLWWCGGHLSDFALEDNVMEFIPCYVEGIFITILMTCWEKWSSCPLREGFIWLGMRLSTCLKEDIQDRVAKEYSLPHFEALLILIQLERCT